MPDDLKKLALSDALIRGNKLKNHTTLCFLRGVKGKTPEGSEFGGAYLALGGTVEGWNEAIMSIRMKNSSDDPLSPRNAPFEYLKFLWPWLTMDDYCEIIGLYNETCQKGHINKLISWVREKEKGLQ